MLYVHENNFKNKIHNNYGGIGKEIEKFYLDTYLKTKLELQEIDFAKDDDVTFKHMADIINDYYDKLDKFTKKYKITSQSKFRSTFLEELSTYLFSDNKYIKNGELGIYNKGIYAGLKIGSDLKVNIMKKDVDFCIGKKSKVIIDGSQYDLIIPIVTIEDKTYLDVSTRN